MEGAGPSSFDWTGSTKVYGTVSDGSYEIISLSDLFRCVTNHIAGSKQEYENLIQRYKVRNQPCQMNPQNSDAYILELILLRYHSDFEQIGLDPFSSKHKVDPERNIYAYMINKLTQLCVASPEQHAHIRGTLLQLNAHLFLKVIKTGLLIGIGANNCIVKIFSPTVEEFQGLKSFEKCLIFTIPHKCLTASPLFWRNWFACLLEWSKITDAWKTVSEHWIEISARQNSEYLISATMAVLIIFREAKNRRCASEWGLFQTNLQPGVTQCMGSLNLDVRDCALIMAYALADLYYSNFLENESAKMETIEISSDRRVFKMLKCFYKNEEFDDLTMDGLSIAEESLSSAVPDQNLIDSFVNSYQPKSFSEIYDELIERNNSDGGADPDKKTKLITCICIQLWCRMHMDTGMADKLTRFIVSELKDFGTGNAGLLSFAATLTLTEISKAQPEAFFNAYSQSIFDKNHYIFGQRLVMLKYYLEVAKFRAGFICVRCCPAELQEFSRLVTEVGSSFEKCLLSGVMNEECFRCMKVFRRAVDIEPSPSTLVTWQEIRDKRIESNTRRFVAKVPSAATATMEIFSSSLAHLFWSAVCNPLFNTNTWVLNTSNPEPQDLNEQFLLTCLTTLENIIYCTNQSASVFYTTFIPGVKILVDTYGKHTRPEVRAGIFRLCYALVNRASDKFRLHDTFGQDWCERLLMLAYGESVPDTKLMIEKTSWMVLSRSFGSA